LTVDGLGPGTDFRISGPLPAALLQGNQAVSFDPNDPVAMPLQLATFAAVDESPWSRGSEEMARLINRSYSGVKPELLSGNDRSPFTD